MRHCKVYVNRPITIEVEGFLSGNRFSENRVWEVHRPSGVMIYIRRLVEADCQKPRIEPSDMLLERPMFSNGLR